jgi:hypothetical protein
MEDDELFSGKSTGGINQQIEVVKTIGDIVYHLHAEDLFKEHFMEVVNAESN